MLKWRFTTNLPIEHGGNLGDIIHNDDMQKWIDLSSAVNPQFYKLTTSTHASALKAYKNLPYQKDSMTLYQAARNYYLAHNTNYDICVANGTQQFIQLLPLLFSPQQNIGIIEPCYGEYAQSILRAGHNLMCYKFPLDRLPSDCNHLIICNPVNPTSHYYSVEQIIQWAKILHQRQGYVIIDEAYMDTKPNMSILAHTFLPNVIVLRSIGKFFGLPGLRLGFLLGNAEIVEKINTLLGPWVVGSNALYIGEQLLSDTQWHTKTINWLQKQSHKQYQMLRHIFEEYPLYGCDFFQTLHHDKAHDLHTYLKSHRIYTRIFDKYPFLMRFGLCRTQKQYAYLKKILTQWTKL